MKFQVTIPYWTEGCPLTVHDVEAQTADEAAQRCIERLAPDCPRKFVTLGPCRCDRCEDARHQAWLQSMKEMA